MLCGSVMFAVLAKDTFGPLLLSLLCWTMLSLTLVFILI